MSPIEHIFLFLFLFFLFSYWGKLKYDEADPLSYWIFASVPILCYAIIVGSRYGWGADYYSYKYRLEHAFSYDEEQVGFRLLNQFVDLIGLNYVGGYVIYSLIFCISVFVLVRSYGADSKYMYAFILPATLIFTTSIIRQGVALSFIMLTVFFLNKKNWTAVILSVLVGMSIHTSTVISACFIGFFYFFASRPLNWKWTIPIYLYFAFIFDVGKIGFISEYLQLLTLGNQFQSYLDNSDRWFGAEAINDIYQQSQVALILSSIFDIAIIYLGYYALKLKPNHQLNYLYNCVVFGLLFMRAVFLFEIMKRFAQPLVIFQFVILGYIVMVFVKIGRSEFNLVKLERMGLSRVLTYYRVLFFFVIVYLVLFWSRFIFQYPEADFFWNS